VTAPRLGRRLSLTDRAEICDAVSRYAHVVDNGTNAEVLAIFTDDVVIEGPISGQHVGRDGVLAWRSSVPERAPGQDRHLIADILISGDRREATAEASFVHLRSEIGPDRSRRPTTVFVAGQFTFVLRRVHRQWLIARRSVRIDSLPPGETHRQNPPSNETRRSHA
jgi:hypothetical protein